MAKAATKTQTRKAFPQWMTLRQKQAKLSGRDHVEPERPEAIDLVQVDDTTGRLSFPTICVCAVCSGVTGVYAGRHGQVHDRRVGLDVALLQHGTYLAKSEGNQNYFNIWHPPRACRCTCDHAWSEKNIGRCLHEITCTKCGHKQISDSSD